MSGVGIDLLEIERLERALERRPRLAERLFTDASASTPPARARPAMHLAARFCAKEAVAKALGTDAAWSFRDVEVVATDAAPEVRLSGTRRPARAAELGRASLAISLTHTDDAGGRRRGRCGERRCPAGSTRSTRPPRCAPPTRGRSRSRACPRST